MLRDALCCSVLQWVAVCCSVLQCVAVRCRLCSNVSQCIAVRHKSSTPPKAPHIVLQCIAVYCSVLQCVAAFEKSISSRTLQESRLCCYSSPISFSISLCFSFMFFPLFLKIISNWRFLYVSITVRKEQKQVRSPLPFDQQSLLLNTRIGETNKLTRDRLKVK